MSGLSTSSFLVITVGTVQKYSSSASIIMLKYFKDSENSLSPSRDFKNHSLYQNKNLLCTSYFQPHKMHTTIFIIWTRKLLCHSTPPSWYYHKIDFIIYYLLLIQSVYVKNITFLIIHIFCQGKTRIISAAFDIITRPYLSLWLSVFV